MTTRMQRHEPLIYAAIRKLTVSAAGAAQVTALDHCRQCNLGPSPSYLEAPASERMQHLPRGSFHPTHALSARGLARDKMEARR